MSKPKTLVLGDSPGTTMHEWMRFNVGGPKPKRYVLAPELRHFMMSMATYVYRHGPFDEIVVSTKHVSDMQYLVGAAFANLEYHGKAPALLLVHEDSNGETTQEQAYREAVFNTMPYDLGESLGSQVVLLTEQHVSHGAVTAILDGMH